MEAPKWEDTKAAPPKWEDTSPVTNPFKANQILNKGVLYDASPEQSAYIQKSLSSHDLEMEEATAYYKAKFGGDDWTPDKTTQTILYEYGQNATPQVANQMNRSASKFNDIKEATLRRTAGTAAMVPTAIKDFKELNNAIVKKFSEKLGLKYKDEAQGIESLFDVGADTMREWAEKEFATANVIQSEYMSGEKLTKLYEDGNYSQIGSDIFNAVQFELPNLIGQIGVGLLFGSPATLALMGGQSGLQRRAEVEEGSLTQRIIDPALHAGVEVATEKFLGTGRILKRMELDEIVSGFKKRAQRWGIDALGGSLSEGGAQGGGNLIKMLFGEDVEIGDGVLLASSVGLILDSTSGQVLTPMTPGDANRIKDQYTDAEIDAMVEDGTLTPEEGEAVKMEPSNPDKANAVNEANKAKFEPKQEEGGQADGVQESGQAEGGQQVVGKPPVANAKFVDELTGKDSEAESNIVRLYHGNREELPSDLKPIYLTENVEEGKSYAFSDYDTRDPNGRFNVFDVDISGMKIKDLSQHERYLGLRSQYSKKMIKELIAEGYDGVRMPEESISGTDYKNYVIFDMSKAKLIDSVTPDRFDSFMEQSKPVEAEQPKGDQQPVSAEKVAPADAEGAKEVVGKPPLYHGTKEDFTNFKESLNPKEGEMFSFGFHFTENKDFAKRYGDRIVEAELDVKNPLDVERMVTKDSELGQWLSQLNPETIWFPLDGKDAVWLKNALDAIPPQKIKKALIDAGYDGLIYNAKFQEADVGGFRTLDEGKTTIALYDSQIKQSKPATIKPDQQPVSAEKVAPADAEGALEKARADAGIDVETAADNEGWMQEDVEPDVDNINRRRSRLTSQLMTPVLSYVKDVSPEVYSRLNRFEYDAHQKKRSYQLESQDFLRGMTDLAKNNPEAFTKLDIALLNENFKEAERYIDKKSVDKVRAMLEGAADEMEATGLVIDRKTGYFPRRVKDYEGLTQELGSELKGEIEIAVNEQMKKARDKGYTLNDEEVSRIINQVISGSYVPVGGRKPRALKRRTIDEVTPDLAQYYYDSAETLMMWINDAADIIETRKFFGKSLKGDDIVDVNESVGDVIAEITERDGLSPEDQNKLIGALRARFGYRPTGKIASQYKSLVAMTTLGQVQNALTQFGDATWSFYENGIGTTIASTLGEKRVKMEDLAIEEVAEEFKTPSGLNSVVNNLFKYTGLKAIDRLGKETLVNAAIERYQSEANLGSFSKDRQDRLDVLFGDKQQSVIDDLKSGEISDDVKYLAFSTLLDWQPVTLSNMPIQYLKNPNGRVLYTLKTFTVKQLDNFRTRAVDNIVEGVETGNAALAANGMGNLLRIAGLMYLSNLPIDLLKDWLSGKDINFTDTMIDNLYKMFGLSRFAVEYATKEGRKPSKVLPETIIPPLNFIDLPATDIQNIIDKMMEGEDIDLMNLESWQLLPFAGRTIYWKWGHGEEKEEARRNKE